MLLYANYSIVWDGRDVELFYVGRSSQKQGVYSLLEKQVW